MNVRRAFLDRIEQYFIDEFNNRSVVSCAGGFGSIRRCLLGVGKFHVLEIVIEFFVEGVIFFKQFLDEFAELVLFDQYGFGIGARLELDVIDSSKVGGIGYTDIQPVASLV